MSLRASLALSLVLLVCACSPIGSTDAGHDAGALADAGIVDAGMGDAGPRDAGRTRPEFLACDGVQIDVPQVPNQCGCDAGVPCFFGQCTFECAECSTLSPCPAGWTCDFIRPPYCSGTCRRAVEDCTEPASGTVQVDAMDWNCSSEGVCRFRHEVIPQDGGVVLRCFAIAPSMASTLMAELPIDAGNWSALFLAKCISTQDLASNECWSHGLEVAVTFQDGGQFAYLNNGAVKPPAPFEAASLSLFSECAAPFKAWDGGTYSLPFD